MRCPGFGVRLSNVCICEVLVFVECWCYKDVAVWVVVFALVGVYGCDMV